MAKLSPNRKSGLAGTVRHAPETSGEDVPGISPNPASSLIMADIAMRAGSYLLRSVVEKNMLRGRYGKDTAREIVENRSASQTLAAVAAAKVASKSVPGALIVGGGVLVKALFDQSKKRRARLRGDKKLRERASGED
ncbi:hypothetical protein OAS19_00460 [Altererythrobacter sp.]|nr:hypothetical protein [Altererythrobacter sp.]